MYFFLFLSVSGSLRSWAGDKVCLPTGRWVFDADEHSKFASLNTAVRIIDQRTCSGEDVGVVKGASAIKPLFVLFLLPPPLLPGPTTKSASQTDQLKVVNDGHAQKRYAHDKAKKLTGV